MPCVAAGLGALACSLLFGVQARAEILFHDDCEDGWEGDWRATVSGAAGSRIEVSDEQARTGSRSFKFVWVADAEGRERTELTLDAVLPFEFGREYWIGYSIFLAEGHRLGSVPGSWLLHGQFHGSPDQGDRAVGRCEPEEDWRNPPFSIHIDRDTGDWLVSSIGDRNVCTRDRAYTDGFRDPGPPAARGRWQDVVIHVVFGFEDDGLLQVWIDGVSVVDRRSITNCFNDLLGPYWKMGTYGFVDPGQTVVVYYDSFTVADGAGSYDDVVPGGGDPAPDCASLGGTCCGDDEVCDGGTASGAAGCASCCVGGVCRAPEAAGRCDGLFGDVELYELCEEQEDRCEFAALTGGESCRAVCEAAGVPCITAFNNIHADCVRDVEDGCDEPRSTEICVCASSPVEGDGGGAADADADSDSDADGGADGGDADGAPPSTVPPAEVGGGCSVAPPPHRGLRGAAWTLALVVAGLSLALVLRSRRRRR